MGFTGMSVRCVDGQKAFCLSRLSNENTRKKERVFKRAWRGSTDVSKPGAEM
jgi:hypothetical protein